jgi:hypothetical protein
MEGPQVSERRSLHSRDRVRVLFTNRTSGPLRLLWLNYEGEEVDYGVVGPGSSEHINTFLTHPWLVRRVVEDEVQDEGQEDKEVFFQWPDQGRLGPLFEAGAFVEKLFPDENEEQLLEVQHFLNGLVRLEVVVRGRYAAPTLLRAALDVVGRRPRLTLASVHLLHLPGTLADLVREDIRGKGGNLTGEQ